MTVMTETKSRHIVNHELRDGVILPIEVTVSGGNISEAEAEAYVNHAYEKYSDKIIDEVSVSLDGEFVDLEYHFSAVPFERIRRITGYLVGTLDRFNNAKRAEVSDRVKHGVGA